MITKTEYSTIQDMILAYWSSLELAEVRAEAAKKGLLTQNSKLAKGDGTFSNWGLELLPADLNPIKTACPAACDCRYSCLAFSGVGNMFKGPSMLAGTELSVPLMAKTRRSFLFLNDKNFFQSLLTIEINRLHMIAGLEGKELGVRLNVTSDYDWTSFVKNNKEIQFYDYTRVWNRLSTKNWHLTYSVSKGTTDPLIQDRLEEGYNVAVVFGGDLPPKFLGYPVVDGDISDARWLDKPGTVVGLKIKSTVGGARGSKPAISRGD